MKAFNKALVAIENKILGEQKDHCHTVKGASLNNSALRDYFYTPQVVMPFNTLLLPNYSIDGDADYNTDEEMSRLPFIEKMLNEYIMSEQFETFMTDPKNALDLNQTEGLGLSEMIAQIRMSTAHIVVRFYYQPFTRTIGYRNPGENIVYCNRKYHDGYTLTDELSNILHEFLHIINVTGPLEGFQHDFEATLRRPFSVNYMANKAVEATEA